MLSMKKLRGMVATAAFMMLFLLISGAMADGAKDVQTARECTAAVNTRPVGEGPYGRVSARLEEGAGAWPDRERGALILALRPDAQKKSGQSSQQTVIGVVLWGMFTLVAVISAAALSKDGMIRYQLLGKADRKRRNGL